MKRLRPKIINKNNIAIQLIDCDYAPQDMEEQLPIACTLIRMIPGSDHCRCCICDGRNVDTRCKIKF